MNGPYFQGPWQSFSYNANVYDLAHLNEYYLEVTDSKKIVRRIAVTFSDHCFTRDPEDGDDPGLLYPGSTRNPGYFCTERYQHSLTLTEHIDQAVPRRVWHIRDGSFAIVPIVTHQGVRVLYGIVFSLDRVKGLPVDLHMRIKTAYPCDEEEIVTFGEIRFAHLIALRMDGKSPPRILDKHRKRPKVT